MSAEFKVGDLVWHGDTYYVTTLASNQGYQLIATGAQLEGLRSGTMKVVAVDTAPKTVWHERNCNARIYPDKQCDCDAKILVDLKPKLVIGKYYKLSEMPVGATCTTELDQSRGWMIVDNNYKLVTVKDLSTDKTYKVYPWIERKLVALPEEQKSEATDVGLTSKQRDDVSRRISVIWPFDGVPSLQTNRAIAEYF
jgi:hypothetical protein